MMSEASSDLEEGIGNADEILKKVELAICEELENDLNVSSNHSYCAITRLYFIRLLFQFKAFLNVSDEFICYKAAFFFSVEM